MILAARELSKETGPQVLVWPTCHLKKLHKHCSDMVDVQFPGHRRKHLGHFNFCLYKNISN